MTDLSPLRKVIIACASLAATASLSACNSHQDLTETLARLKSEPVDATAQAGDAQSGTASDRRIDKRDVDLVLNTARDLTVNKGGLLRTGAVNAAALHITVVDPRQQEADRTQLDERVVDGEASAVPSAASGAAPSAAQLAAMHDLPDVPIAVASNAPFYGPATGATAVSAAHTAAKVNASSGRFVQIGSFSNTSAAQMAWAGLQERFPGVDRYNAAYQTVTTNAGKTLVRLKLGPVKSMGQAQALCSQLNIRDSWCAKAS